MSEQPVSLRQSGLWGAVAFGVALAVIIGIRLDQAALAVMVGVVCGVVAGIPTSLLIVALLRRRDRPGERRETKRQQPAMAPSPPVIVLAPSANPQLPQPATWSGGYAPSSGGRRRFAVIGQEEIKELEEINDEFDYWQDEI